MAEWPNGILKHAPPTNFNLAAYGQDPPSRK
jgi:hypothetical protein